MLVEKRRSDKMYIMYKGAQRSDKRYDIKGVHYTYDINYARVVYIPNIVHICIYNKVCTAVDLRLR